MVQNRFRTNLPLLAPQCGTFSILDLDPCRLDADRVGVLCPRLLINKEMVHAVPAKHKAQSRNAKHASGGHGHDHEDGEDSDPYTFSQAAADLDDDAEDEDLLHSASGFLFERPDVNYRDVYCGGTTDAGVLQLAKLLGWEAELLALHEGYVPPSPAQTASSAPDRQPIQPSGNAGKWKWIYQSQLLRAHTDKECL
jgi:hypothetical protein